MEASGPVRPAGRPDLQFEQNRAIKLGPGHDLSIVDWRPADRNLGRKSLEDDLKIIKHVRLSDIWSRQDHTRPATSGFSGLQHG